MFKKREEEEEELRQSNIDGMNLLKLHYMHVYKCTETPLYNSFMPIKFGKNKIK